MPITTAELEIALIDPESLSTEDLAAVLAAFPNMPGLSDVAADRLLRLHSIVCNM